MKNLSTCRPGRLAALQPDLIATTALWLVALAAMLLIFNPTALLVSLLPGHAVTKSARWASELSR